MDKRLTKISKFLALVLRHKPETIGIILGSDGWTDIDTLTNKSNQYGMEITRDDIENIVNTNDKKRYSISDDGRMMRAEQGHSIETIDIGYDSIEPPEFLYHGTSLKNKDIIFKEGISKMNRQYVHLSEDISTAKSVAKRHSKNICIFIISVHDMYRNGYVFYKSKNNVWLTNNVPPQYIIETNGE
ncbi:MAG: RNA 2'-phosphotransferase [Caudoviricetes sp.]|nr:MAG: RNA 2'-phosphotransferase [Caudoviricetes sp.]